jgi:hypothetical protein
MPVLFLDSAFGDELDWPTSQLAGEALIIIAIHPLLPTIEIEYI